MTGSNQQVAMSPEEQAIIAQQDHDNKFAILRKINEYKSIGRDAFVKMYGYDTEAQLYDAAKIANIPFKIDYDFGDYAQQFTNEATFGLYGLFDNDVADEGKYSRGTGMVAAKGLGMIGSMAATGGAGLVAKAGRAAVIGADALRLTRMAKASKALLGVSDDVARGVASSSGKVLSFLEKKGASSAEMFARDKAGMSLRREFVSAGHGTLEDISLLKNAGKVATNAEAGGETAGWIKKTWDTANKTFKKAVSAGENPYGLDSVIRPREVQNAAKGLADAAKLSKVKGATITDADKLLELMSGKMKAQGVQSKLWTGAKYGATIGGVRSGTEAWATDTDYLPVDGGTAERASKAAGASLQGALTGGLAGGTLAGLSLSRFTPKAIGITGAGITGAGLVSGSEGLTQLGTGVMLAGGLKALDPSEVINIRRPQTVPQGPSTGLSPSAIVRGNPPSGQLALLGSGRPVLPGSRQPALLGSGPGPRLSVPHTTAPMPQTTELLAMRSAILKKLGSGNLSPAHAEKLKNTLMKINEFLGQNGA